jgi:hypothetical protein
MLLVISEVFMLSSDWLMLVMTVSSDRGSQVLWGRKEMKDLMDYLDKR